MPRLERPIKLKWRTVQSIAVALKVNPVHVHLVATAQRQGREDLIAAIEQEAQKELELSEKAAV